MLPDSLACWGWFPGGRETWKIELEFTKWGSRKTAGTNVQVMVGSFRKTWPLLAYRTSFCELETGAPSAWAEHVLVSGGLSPWAVSNLYNCAWSLGSTELWLPVPHLPTEGLFNSGTLLGCQALQGWASRRVPVFKDLHLLADFVV